MQIPIKLVIADDHEVYRDGLKALLDKSGGFQVIGEAANGKDLIQVCEKTLPDVVLTDIMMPVMDGIEATKYLSEHLPSIRVIALSMFNQDNLITDMLRAGAIGYLIKNAGKADILNAIESVYRDVPYYCKSTSIKLAKLVGNLRFGGSQTKAQFTEKEMAVIRMICEEKTTREIADELYASIRTVEDYREKIKEKMEVKSAAGIVIYAIREKIYSITPS